MISKFTIKTDGKTAHERCRGRKFNKPIPLFGEYIMYLKHQSKSVKEHLEPRWESVVFLGINKSSQEIVVGTPQGAVKSPEYRTKGSHGEK